ncbi:MAG: SMI1/KNR4 family protein [Verrucomicrobiota bacterium]
MSKPDQAFPARLASLNGPEYDYADGDGIDFEPYTEFLSAEETTGWFRAWTGNEAADGSCFRVFGQDGTGGYAAFWMEHPDRPILEQPIVFMGSEGEKGVVASNFDSYLWLLAPGYGPCESVICPIEDGSPHGQFLAFARENSSEEQMSVRTVLEQARSRYPGFPDLIDSLCR